MWNLGVIVSIIFGLFYIYLLYNFFSFISFGINAILLAILLFLIFRDLRNNDHHKYYIVSTGLTALIFIFSTWSPIAAVFGVLEGVGISLVTILAFLMFAFSYWVAFCYEFYRYQKSKNLFK